MKTHRSTIALLAKPRAQTCPTDAIVFGDLLDKTSRVYKLAHDARAYNVFEELGTKPAVYYLRPRGIDDRI